MENTKIEVSVEIKKETPKAFFVTDGDKEAWLPKSQITVTGSVNLGSVYNIKIPEWLAKDKELI